jgi:hypothetical protein
MKIFLLKLSKFGIIFFISIILFSQCCLTAFDEMMGVSKDAGYVEPRYFPPPMPAYLQITNQSQWALKHLFIYKEDEKYWDVRNRLDTGIPPGDSIEYCLDSNEYSFTVTRLKNQDGPLLAFSFASPQTFHTYSLTELEFLENEFRLEKTRAGLLGEGDWEREYTHLKDEYDKAHPDQEETENTQETEEMNESGKIESKNTEPLNTDKKEIPGCQAYREEAKDILVDELCACP